MVTRLLFSFELELKEYATPAFEATKYLFSKLSLSVDEVITLTNQRVIFETRFMMKSNV